MCYVTTFVPPLQSIATAPPTNGEISQWWLSLHETRIEMEQIERERERDRAGVREILSLLATARDPLFQVLGGLCEYLFAQTSAVRWESRAATAEGELRCPCACLKTATRIIITLFPCSPVQVRLAGIPVVYSVTCLAGLSIEIRLFQAA